MTPEQEKALKALLAIGQMIVDSIKEGDPNDMGVPGGTLYAALMRHGCTLEQFNMMMGALVGAGKVTQHGQLYRAVR